MGWFERALTPDTDLSAIPTDRLMREYQATADAFDYISQSTAAAEFATPDNPVVVDGEALMSALNGTLLHNHIGTELKSRGFSIAEDS